MKKTVVVYYKLCEGEEGRGNKKKMITDPPN